MQAQMASFKESHHFYSAGCASKRAKGVTRIRIYFPRFWRGNATIVRDCCHDRARLGCSKRRACLRSLPACGFADQRVLNCKAASVVGQPESCATPCNLVQPDSRMRETNPIAPKCTRMHRFAPRARWESESSSGLGSRNVAKCLTRSRKRETNPIRALVFQKARCASSYRTPPSPEPTQFDWIEPHRHNANFSTEGRLGHSSCR